MSAFVGIYQPTFAVLATDSRVTLSRDGKREGHFDGSSKVRDGGNDTVYMVTEHLGHKVSAKFQKIVSKPLRGKTVSQKVSWLKRQFDVHGIDKVYVYIAGYEDGPKLGLVRPEQAGLWEFPPGGGTLTMGLDHLIPRLWNKVYVENDEGGYDEMSPVELDHDSLTITEAVDRAIFLIQACGKYAELASKGTDDPWDSPTVGGPIDLVIIQSGGPLRFRIGGGYGLDTDYIRLTKALEDHG